MRQKKEMEQKTATLKQVQETIKSLKTDVAKLNGFFNSHTLQEARNSEQAVLQLYSVILEKYSRCKTTLDAFVDEQENLRLQADQERLFGSGKRQTRKDRKLSAANEEFILAYMDAEASFKKIEGLITDVDARVKAVTDKTKSAEVAPEPVQTPAESAEIEEVIPVSASRLDIPAAVNHEESRLNPTTKPTSTKTIVD